MFYFSFVTFSLVEINVLDSILILIFRLDAFSFWIHGRGSVLVPKAALIERACDPYGFSFKTVQPSLVADCAQALNKAGKDLARVCLAKLMKPLA